MTTLADIASLRVISVVPQFYIEDNNSVWVNFSDFLESGGAHLLQEVSTVRQSGERRFGSFEVQIPGITVRLMNRNGYFSKPFPSSLLAVDGNAASFTTSKKGKYSVLSNRRARVSAVLYYRDDTFVEEVIATYLIYGQKKLTAKTFEIRLESLAQPLMTRDSAERVKDALDWYSNRPVSFLVQELLKLRYLESGAFTVPTTFVIPDSIQIPTAAYQNDDAGEQRGLSHYGRLPEIDENGNWLNKGYVTRALLFRSSKLYHGSDDKFYEWDPTTEVSTQKAAVTSTQNIQKIWYNTQNSRFYIVSWKTATDTGANNRNHLFRVYWYTSGGGMNLIFGNDNIACVGESWRNGTVLTSIRYIGQDGVTSYGENILIPFRQYVELTEGLYTTEPGRIRKKDGLLSGTDNITVFDAGVSSFIDSGYYFSLSKSTGMIPSTPPPMNFKFSMGQDPFIIFVNDYSTAGAIVYVESNNDANGNYALKILDLSTNVSGTIIGADKDPWQVGSNDVEPICGCAKGDANTIYVAVIRWRDDSGDNDSVVYILEINIATGATTVRYTSSSDSNTYWTPLWMVYTNSKLYMSVLDRTRVDEQGRYRVVSHPTSTQNSFDGIANNIFLNRLSKPIENSSGDLYFIEEAGAMSLHFLDVSADQIITKANGISVVDEDIWNRAIAIDTDSSPDIVYGLTSMIPGEFMNSDEQEGKYYLWKYDTDLTDRIEYADFSGMNTWEALGQLTQYVYYDHGFGRRGEYYLSAKPTSADSASLTIADDDSGDVEILKDGGGEYMIAIEIDEKKIYNFVQVTPYIVSVREPSFQYIQSERDEDQSNFNYELHVQQRDTLKKNIRMKCLTSGRMSSTNIFFKFEVYDEDVNTILRANVANGATTIKVNVDVSNFKEGDTIKLKSKDDEEVVTVSADPGDDDIQERQLDVTAIDAANGYYLNDQVVITRLQSTGTSAQARVNIEDDPYFTKWTSNDWDNAHSRSNVGDYEDTTVFLFSAQSMRLQGEILGTPTFVRRYDSSNFLVDTTYTVKIGVKGHRGDADFPRTNVTINITGATQAVQSWSGDVTSSTTEEVEWLRGTFITHASLASDIDLTITLDNNEGEAWIGAIFLMEEEHQEIPMIAFKANSRFVPIGETNVWLKFVRADNEGQFKEGDAIDITCPGKVLEQRELFRAQYTDMDSKNINGLVPYPGTVDNRFVNRRRVNDVARRLGSISPNPKMFITTRIPLDLRMTVWDEDTEKRRVINVKSQQLLLGSGDYTEKCQVLNVDHDLRGKTTTVSAVSFNDI